MTVSDKQLEAAATPVAPAHLPWLEPYWQHLRQRFIVASRDDYRAQPHALMLTAARGSGRVMLADQLAMWLLCENAQASACGACMGCKLFQAGSHPDLLRLRLEEGSNSIKVEQIRDLIGSLTLTAGLNGWRIAILHDASRMTESAANALLKTLEEPGARTLLILLCDQRMTLPATIHSRCQQITLHPPAHDQALAWLRTLHGADDATLELALRLAHAAPLRAWQLLHEHGVEQAALVHSGLRAAGSEQAVDTVLESWTELPPDACWQWILSWLHQWSRQLAGRSGAADPALRELLSLYDLAARSAHLTNTGLRQDLQLQSWLLQWQAVTHAHGIIQHLD